MLPDDSPLVVNAYVHYLYTGDMNIEEICAVNPEDNTASELEHHTAARQEQMLAVQLYTFSEKIQDIRAKNEAVRAMRRCVYKIRAAGKWLVPRSKAIRHIYSNTLPACRMRKLIVDIFAYYGDPDVLPPRVDVNSEFFFDVAKASMRIHSKAVFTTIPEKDIEMYLEKVQ